jgi:uncharacterized protein DUF4136
MRFKALLPVVVIAAALACSTLKTSADFDPKTDFTKYKTWAWKDDRSIKDPLWVKRIQDALESTLSTRGLTRNEQSSDLWVAVHARFSEQTQVTSYDTGWGYGYGWRYGGGGMTTTRVEQIPVGTLIVDLVDAQRKELVWRGTGSDTLNPQRSPEEKEKALREALAKMFENYPPRSK